MVVQSDVDPIEALLWHSAMSSRVTQSRLAKGGLSRLAKQGKSERPLEDLIWPGHTLVEALAGLEISYAEKRLIPIK